MNRSLAIIITGLLLFIPGLLTAQPAVNWYFGSRVALNFNPANGQIPYQGSLTAMVAQEGSASISDNDGNLLFYTNGETIYNSDNEIMANGTGIGGHSSSCQSALIVPFPSNDSLFYVFTSDAIENNFEAGYRYSIVNIRRNNGSGEVILKNQLLSASGTERMTAARHRNGIDVWIIINEMNSNIFKAMLINCNGLTSTSVESVAGETMNQHFRNNTGYMKVSPDGEQLCQTHFPSIGPNGQQPNFVQLFDFDNSTGIISNARKIGLNDAFYTNCEFSPDSKLLYLTRPYENAVDQLEIRLPSVTQVNASRIRLQGLIGYQGIQLAIDRKIYLIGNSRDISAILNPDIKGDGCRLTTDHIRLSAGMGMYGSPGFINDAAVNPANGFSFLIEDACAGSVRFSGTTTLSGNLTWQWDFGDGGTSTEQNPIHTFNPSNQSFLVKLKITSASGCGQVTASAVVTADTSTEKMNFTYRTVCDSGYVQFINGNDLLPGESFTWDFGDGHFSGDVHPVHSYDQPGNYEVVLTRLSTNPCRNKTITDSIRLSTLSLQVSPDREIIAGQSIRLIATSAATSYQWTPSTWLNNSTIADPVTTPYSNIIYRVIATDTAGCKTSASITITVTEPADIYVPTGFTPNNDGNNDIFRPFYHSGITLQEFAVFNRWGIKVYATKNRGEGWDGKIKNKMQNDGIYVWIIQAINSNGKNITRKGTVALIR